jgi:phage portal protein BeeE
MLGRWRKKPEPRVQEWGSLDPRLAEAFGISRTAAGVSVTATSAEGLATVSACVQAIAAGIASLPALVYRDTDGGREEAPDHPLARMIRDGVNDREGWPDFIESLVANALLRGNGLAEIVADDRGRLRELYSIPWAWVAPRVLTSGRLAFEVTDMYGARGAPGHMRRLLNAEVIHIKDRSDDGMLGRSRLSRARETIGTALAVQLFAASTYANQATPMVMRWLPSRPSPRWRRPDHGPPRRTAAKPAASRALPRSCSAVRRDQRGQVRCSCQRRQNAETHCS